MTRNDPDEQPTYQWLLPVVALLLMLVGGPVAKAYTGMTGVIGVFAVSFALLSIWANLMAESTRRAGA